MKNIAIVPAGKELLENNLFNLDSKQNWDDHLLPFYILKKELLKQDIEINTIDVYKNLREIDLVFFFDVKE